MIVVHLIGGLGNQMFQYSCAYALGKRCGFEVLIDLDDLSWYNRHGGIRLNEAMDISVRRATDAELSDLLGWRHYRSCRRLRLHRFRTSRRIIKEPHFHYWSGLSSIRDNSYIVGYWQSERYFADVAGSLRQEFRIREPIAGPNLALANQVADDRSVSIHVRRGDYVTNSRASKLHGTCSVDYYHAAIARIARCVKDPVFFVFSDDVPWARRSLQIPFDVIYVENNRRDPVQDLRLMSLCRHHIIANSSFSWWAAWLDPRKDKTVIAPAKWFLKPRRTEDLVPSEWIRL